MYRGGGVATAATTQAEIASGPVSFSELEGIGHPDAREAVAEFERLIASRTSPHPSVTVFVAARRGEAAFSGNTPVGGPLLDLDPRPQRS